MKGRKQKSDVLLIDSAQLKEALWGVGDTPAAGPCMVYRLKPK